jgi:hypothetical protein
VKLKNWVKPMSIREALVRHERAGGVSVGRSWRWQGGEGECPGNLSHVTLRTDGTEPTGPLCSLNCTRTLQSSEL